MLKQHTDNAVSLCPIPAALVNGASVYAILLLTLVSLVVNCDSASIWLSASVPFEGEML